MLFGVDIPFELTPRYNIAPTQSTLMIRNEGNKLLAVKARWGFIPSWRKGEKKMLEPINARSESAAASKLFAGALRTQRCVIPASGFYEWQVVTGKRTKRPYHIEPLGADVLALAGLWSPWKPKDAQIIESFTILTCAPNEVMRPIHDRMPVILSLDAIKAWLDPAIDDAATVTAMLRPAPAGSIIAREVSPWVNTPAHDDPACIQPVSRSAPEEPPGLFT